MLYGAGGKVFGGGSLNYAVGLAPGLRLYTVTRASLIYDSRFVPPERDDWDGAVAIYALLSGSVHLRDPEQLFNGPLVLAFGQEIIDGAAGRRGRSFWNAGDPLRVVQLTVARRYWRGPPVAQATTLVSASADPALFDRLSEAKATFETATRYEAQVAGAQLIDEFIRLGLIDEDARPIAPVASTGHGRVWDALLNAWSRGALPSLTDLGFTSHLSIRQVQRDLRELVTSMLLPKRGWRSGMLEWRLKLAVTLLSAPEATAATVARAVGYRGQDELTRALRNAGIASPREIRDSFLALRT